jgi:hypothetical protein
MAQLQILEIANPTFIDILLVISKTITKNFKSLKFECFPLELIWVGYGNKMIDLDMGNIKKGYDQIKKYWKEQLIENRNQFRGGIRESFLGQDDGLMASATEFFIANELCIIEKEEEDLLLVKESKKREKNRLKRQAQNEKKKEERRASEALSKTIVRIKVPQAGKIQGKTVVHVRKEVIPNEQDWEEEILFKLE